MPLAVLRSVLTATLLSLAGAGGAATLTVHVADQSAASVDDAVIYALPIDGNVPLKAPLPAEIAQVNKTFVPTVTVVQTGSAVTFPNRDTVRHQVYSFSPAKVFELRLYAGVPAAPIVFDKAGLVVLGCNIHDRMVAYVMVVDTSWFGKSDASGLAKIEGMPAGDYKLVVWHPRMPSEDAPRNVRVNADMRIDVSIGLKPAA
jgi:plastocyanin